MSNTNKISQQIKIWRHVNGLGQKDLALRLGVTQQAVSNWERNKDLPSQQIISKLKDLIATSNELLIDRAFISNQSTVRALIDLDGAKLVGFSFGFKNIWNDFCALYDMPLEEKLINELQWLSLNHQVRNEIYNGEIPILSGISNKHIDVNMGPAFKHRWHICFRRYGTRIIADMIFEPCDAQEQTGIDRILRVSDLKS